jgi:small subunit ribosomal protein S14
MIAMNERDNKRRLLVSKYEIKRIFYKSIIRDENIPSFIKYQATIRLAELPRNSSKIRIKNRCIMTGRGKSVYRFCKLSRIVFRELAAKGSLVGITKSSW